MPVKDVLVIGYGNPLRGDDGVGIAAVGMLAGRVECGTAGACAQVRYTAVHQLTPELAADIAQAGLVIFIDAACDNVQGEITRRKVHPVRSSPETFSHHLTPEILLTYSERLYGACPEAILFSVGGASFKHGEGLSEPVRAALPVLLAEIEAACAATQS